MSKSTSNSQSVTLDLSNSADSSSIPSSLSHPHFITAYGPKQRSRLFFNGPGRTIQSFKDECDINTIMKRFEATGQVSHLNNRAPQFGDVDAFDFRTAMDLVLDARAKFDALPSKVRDRFANDPARLLAFLDDASNRDEALALGLLNPPPAPEPTPAPPAPPASS
jgi:phage internal scaffolding protein